MEKNSSEIRNERNEGMTTGGVMTWMLRERNGYKRHPRTTVRGGRAAGRGLPAITDNESNLLVSCTSDLRFRKL